MAQSLQIVLPLFIVIGVGYALRRSGFLSKAGEDWMNRLTFYVALPLLFAVSIGNTRMENLAVGGITLVYGAAALVVVVITYLFTAWMAPAVRGALVVSSFRGNLAYLGFPVIAATLGPEALAKAAFVVGIISIMVQILSVVILERLRTHNTSISLLRQMQRVIVNPLVVGCVLGLGLRVAPFSLPGPLLNSMEMIGNLALPLALLTLGASMVVPIKRSALLSAGTIVVVKNLLMPALGWAMGSWLFVLSGPDFELAVIMLACPVAIVAFSVVKELGGDAPLCATVINLSTLVSLVTLTGWIAFLH